MLSKKLDYPEWSINAFDIVYHMIAWVFLSGLLFSSILELLKWRSGKSGNTWNLKLESFKALVHITGFLVIIAGISIPVLLYLGNRNEWNISDTLLVSIPTFILAVLVAQQNLVNSTNYFLSEISREKSLITAVKQCVSDINASFAHDQKPQKFTIQKLKKSLEHLSRESRVEEFVAYAIQAQLTLETVIEKDSKEFWRGFTSILEKNLDEQKIKKI